MSLDFKLMFVYHGCMMAIFIAGQAFTVSREMTTTGLLVVALVALSLRHRRMSNWYWPPVRLRNIVEALFAAAATAFFLFAATPMFPPTDPRALPWYFAGLGIGIFGILTSLRVVNTSEADFLQSCRMINQEGREIEHTSRLPVKDSELVWKKTARGIYTVAFMLVWTLGVASFFLLGRAFSGGSPTPTPAQAEPLTDHGKTVFITQRQKQQIDGIQLGSWIGVPVVLIGGLVLHFVVGVKLFPSAPTISEYLADRTRPKSNTPSS